MAKYQGVNNSTFSYTTTSAQCLPSIVGALKRTQFIITNTNSTQILTIAKGYVPVVAGSGIRLGPYESYIESTDSGFTCWQGPIQAIGDGAGTLSIVEGFEEQ